MLDFKSEKMYQLTMNKVKLMLKNGLITEDEYAEIDTIFLKKYNPTLGILYSDNCLQ
jgi:transcription initiation factor IIE alpha subunit